ncbi:MAG: LytTR family transcriptional regulator DNA-binding domain-containing protein [Bacteroidia bacterium]|nr:LytTR family transcriptional regulator DNA-binding domain-containing protein [Bacteroidia bacterium]
MKNALTNLIVVPDGNNKKHPIDVRVVVKIKLEDDITQIYFYNSRMMKLEKSLSYFNELIVRHDFIRINKECIINPQYLIGLRPGRKIMALMYDGSEEMVAKEVRKTLAHYVLESVNL